MYGDIDEWIVALRHRFQKDPLLAEDEAAQCKHLFEHESLDVRQYITRKQTLLYDSGLEDETNMIQKIWRDLDPPLQTAVALYPDMEMEDFVSSCYAKEYSAHRAFKQQKRNTKAQIQIMSQEYIRNRQQREAQNRDRQRNAAPVTIQAPVVATTEPVKTLKALPAPSTRPALKGFDAYDDKLAYPCTHCGGNHRDNKCPTRPPRRYGQKRVSFLTRAVQQALDNDFSDEDNEMTDAPNSATHSDGHDEDGFQAMLASCSGNA
ncbi:hypothetical protein GQ44DRAFT_168546 [Phaeosphaeriaceae sp. PMI808]|nr:hypothetical protein GQ44DRAFT_168546 [Phaeosphaeriaceae sp. PMI808]